MCYSWPMFDRLITTLSIIFTLLVALLIYLVIPFEGILFALWLAWIPGITIAFFMEPLVSWICLAWLRLSAS